MIVICRKMPTAVCRFKYFLTPQNHRAIEYSDTGAKTDLHRSTEVMPRSFKKRKKKSTFQGIVRWSQNLSFKSKQMTQSEVEPNLNVKISTPLHFAHVFLNTVSPKQETIPPERRSLLFYHPKGEKFILNLSSILSNL